MMCFYIFNNYKIIGEYELSQMGVAVSLDEDNLKYTISQHELIYNDLLKYGYTYIGSVNPRLLLVTDFKSVDEFIINRYNRTKECMKTQIRNFILNKLIK